MRVEVLLFGPEAAAVGNDRLAVEVADAQPTCAAVKAAIVETQPQLERVRSTWRLAVNHRFADDPQRIGPEDEVALIGLVGGG